MLILSKFKDYYDYLQGIYGIDTKKVLDRTKVNSQYVQDYININPKESLFHYPEEILYFCGNIYKLYNRANYDYWWGNEEKIRMYDRYLGWINRDGFEVVYQDDKIVWIKESSESKGDNQIDFPYYLLATYNAKVIEYKSIPVLKHIHFDKVMAPDECYRRIEEYISYREPEPNTDPNDMNRYESKGFDKKTSFRNM